MTLPTLTFNDNSPAMAAVLLTPIPGFGVIIDAEQCGQLIGLTQEEVQSRALKGQLPGKKYGRGWRFVAAQVVLFVTAEAAQNLQKRPSTDDVETPNLKSSLRRSKTLSVVEARPTRGRGRPAREITIPD